jgi:hypothetical protein
VDEAGVTHPSSQEMRQQLMRPASVEKNPSEQQDNESGERDVYGRWQRAFSEISEMTPKYRSRFNGRELKRLIEKRST